MAKKFIFFLIPLQILMVVEKYVNADTRCHQLNDFGSNILILGDSFFTSQDLINLCEDFTNVIAESFNTSNVYNLAIDGGRFIIEDQNYSKLDILSNYFHFNWDIIIIGGGANDFLSCNADTKCMEIMNDKVLEKLKNFLSKLNHQNLIIYFIYFDQVSSFAPAEWKKNISLGAGSYIKNIYQNLQNENQQYKFINITPLILDQPEYWLEDGYHPSTKAYKLIPNFLN